MMSAKFFSQIKTYKDKAFQISRKVPSNYGFEFLKETEGYEKAHGGIFNYFFDYTSSKWFNWDYVNREY